MQVKAFTEVRTVHGVMVETDTLSFRDGKNNSGLLVGPVVKVTKLTTLTSIAYGFTKGEAYSLKEYGNVVRHVGPHALIVAEGQTYTMRDFYSHVLTL